MKVLLLQDLKGKGKKGDIITVSEGYGRNYLIPKKFAREVDAEVLSEKKSKDEAFQYRKNLELAQAKKLVECLNGKVVVVKVRSGVDGKIFGTVTSKDIAQAINDVFDVTIDKKKLVLPEIKQFGVYDFKVKVYGQNIAKMKVDVKSV